MRRALREHWPEYLIEACLLGCFMISASLWALALEHPDSPLRAEIGDPLARRALMGLAMGATAIALIYSRLGKRSGAHFNPAVTLTFLRLRKVRPPDALFYALAHFAGAVAGMLLVDAFLHRWLADPAVRHVATRPGPWGAWAAFVAELSISCALMLVVLASTSHPRTARFTGLFAGACVALWIVLVGPVSGMSMNPARSFGSALAEGSFEAWWVYAGAPLAGMLLAAELHPRLFRARAVHCAKLHHQNRSRCIFCGASAGGNR